MAIFTSMHPVDDVRVATKFATSFLDAGFDVTWIGPWRVAHGTQTFDERIRFKTVPAPRSRPHRVSSLLRLLVVALRTRDVAWWYTPDPDAALALTRVRYLLRGRIIFDVHEVFHTGHMDSWVGTGRANWLREAVRRVIRRAARASDLLVGVSAAVLEPYASPRTQELVVANYAPAWFADAGAAEPPGADAPLRFFHGNLVPNNGSGPVSEAFRRLRASRGAPAELIFLHSGATGSTAEEAPWTDEDDGSGIRVLERRPHREMPRLLATCSVGLIGYGRDLGAASLPNRLFEYMAAGLAILAPTYSPLIATILETEQIGLTADFEDPADIARAMAWCLDHPVEVRAMGRRARQAFLERYNWQSEFQRLLHAMDAIEAHGPGNGATRTASAATR